MWLTVIHLLNILIFKSPNRCINNSNINTLIQFSFRKTSEFVTFHYQIKLWLHIRQHRFSTIVNVSTLQVRFAYLLPDAPADLDQKFLDQLFPGGKKRWTTNNGTPTPSAPLCREGTNTTASGQPSREVTREGSNYSSWRILLSPPVCASSSQLINTSFNSHRSSKLQILNWHS